MATNKREDLLNLFKLEASIEDMVAPLADGDERLLELLRVSAGRVLRNTYRSWLSTNGLFAIQVALMAARPDACHVRDWLKSSITSNARWLSNVDEAGRPKKLLKCSTLKALVDEADKSMLREAGRLSKRPLVEGHETVEYELPDGWTIVRMLTPEALDRESAIMQHCVGQGSYDHKIKGIDKKDGIFSLRDPAGKPHATLEVFCGHVEQLQGKQNAVPLQNYVDMVVRYLEWAGIRVTSRELALVTDRSGKIHSFYDLPEVLDIDGGVILRNSEERPIRLPRVIRCANLTLDGTRFSSVPEVVDVSDSVDFYCDAVAVLPASLPGKGRISIHGSEMTSLPDGFTARGNLKLAETPYLRQLPPGLHVGGELCLRYSKITFKTIPSDARFRRLDISDTPITSFDTNCFLPEVGEEDENRCLIASRSGLKEIVGTPRFSRLDLWNTPMASLPPGTTVSHTLNISGTSITEIPQAAVPAIILDAVGCTINAMPEMVDCEHVSLNQAIINLSAGISCVGDLEMREATIPPMLKAIRAESIDLSDAKLERLPEILEAAHINLKDTRITEIGDGMQTRRLTVSSGISKIGSGASVTEHLVLWDQGKKARFSEELTLDEARSRIRETGSLAADPRKEPRYLVVYDEFHHFSRYRSLKERRRVRNENGNSVLRYVADTWRRAWSASGETPGNEARQ